MNLSLFAAVAAGGAIGAMVRYAISLVIAGGIFGISGPMATLTVNIAGSALMGVLAAAIAVGLTVPETLRLFISVGFLGALTTFSSFALDAGHLFQRQGMMMAALYIGLSVLLSLAAFAIMHGVTTTLMTRGS